jgi:hypothetical protein
MVEKDDRKDEWTVNVPGLNVVQLMQKLDRLAVAFERLATAEEERNSLMREHLNNQALV